MDLPSSSRGPSRRLINGLGFAGCLLTLGIGLGVLEVYLQMAPCNLCLLQRLILALLAGVFLLAALHDPRSWGARVYGLLIGLVAASGAAVAARHLWIQYVPGDHGACGADLSYLLETQPLLEVLRRVLTGSGDCAELQTFLGLSIPLWALLAFLGLGLMGVVRNWRRI